MRKILLLSCFISINIALLAQYQVGFKVLTLRDAPRYRNIITNVYYPASTNGTDAPIINDGTKFPVVSFGHGFVMSSLAYQWLAQLLASNGYIVGFPASEEGLPNHAAFGKDELYVARALRNFGDSSNSFLYQKTNGYTAIGGHSMGGGASFLAANGANDITTLFNFAAAETFPLYGIIASDAAKNITIPALVFSGSKDCVAPAATNSQKMYQNLKSEYKVFANIIGGSHCQFADPNKTVCEVGELAACFGTTYITAVQQQNRVAALLLPWLDFWLKRDCTAKTTFYNNITANLNQIDTLQSKPLDCSTVNITTSVFNKIAKNLTIFPNPSNGIFTIDWKLLNATVTLNLFNINGELLDTKKDFQTSTSILDYTYLPKGIYTLQIIYNNENYLTKLVIN